MAIGSKDISKDTPKNNNKSSSSNKSWQNYGPTNNSSNNSKNKTSSNKSNNSSNNSKKETISNNNSNNSPNRTPSVHYCTNRSPGWDGRKFSRYYIKVSMSCTSIPGKWSPYVIEVSSNEFYSKPVCSGKPGPDFIEEARCEVCGSDYRNGPDSSCKVYK